MLRMNTCQGFRGPENAVDRLIERGYDAREIAERLDVPRWMAIERFGARLWAEEGIEVVW